MRLIKKCVYYSGPPVISGSKQPKQKGYRLILFGRMFEWRGRVIQGWEPGYDELIVNGGYYE